MFGLISKIIFQVVVNGVGLLAIDYFVAGAVLSGGWIILLEISVVLAILNVLAKPVLKFIFGPIIVLTLGLFILILNAIILWFGTWLFPQYLIILIGWPLFWSTLIITLINIVFNIARKSKD